ncbi:MAG: type II restriction endonuclease [Eubacteriales bacterium]
MKYLEIYKKMGLKNSDEVFEYIINNLKSTNRTFDFYVDWSKVFNNIKNIEVELNILNYLIGKRNINEELKELIRKYPSIVAVIPVLIAVRDKKLEILSEFKYNDWIYSNYSFKKEKSYSESQIQLIVDFCKKVGLLDLFSSKKIKNVVDYCIGLEVGIGTNGRKNRGGKIMEDIIEFYVQEVCEKLRLNYLSQATKKKIMYEWNIEIPIDKSSRQYDFAIYKNDKLILIETNFFSGGGSKLKSVAGEFRNLNNFLLNKQCVDKFIWITDGMGWKTAHLPLKETFMNNDYLLNTKMILEGVLEEVIKL